MKNAKQSMARGKGFSLIELLLVIGFISGALILAFVTYPKVDATNKANVESQHLVIITGGVKTLYTVAKSYDGLDNNVLVRARLVPDDLQVSGGSISNIWGGSITVGASPGNPLTYEVVYTGVPTSECTKLSTGIATSFLAVVINYSTTVLDRRNGAGPTTVEPSAAASACSQVISNVMVFTGN